MSCDAKIRPFPNDTEVACWRVLDSHTEHRGTLRDYAWPGSKTDISWQENDRRNFHGEWPGRCLLLGALIPCTLPNGHHGRCAP